MSNESRKLPTRPGWWWRETANGMRISEVAEGYGGLVGAASGCPVADAPCEWLAPIPGPAVLAALAEYDRLDALIEGSDEVHADQPDVLRVMLRRSEALSALALAIRAERDGAA